MDKVPAIDTALVEWLEQIYPDRCPNPNMSDREIWIACGAVGVTRKLRALLEEQWENKLGN